MLTLTYIFGSMKILVWQLIRIPLGRKEGEFKSKWIVHIQVTTIVKLNPQPWYVLKENTSIHYVAKQYLLIDWIYTIFLNLMGRLFRTKFYLFCCQGIHHSSSVRQS